MSTTETRTQAQIGSRVYEGSPCSRCGTAYDVCTESVLNGQPRRACCAGCKLSPTHDERQLPPSVRCIVEHHTGHTWTITFPDATVTAGFVAATTFRAEPEQVVLGADVEVIDPSGTRRGYLDAAEYGERPDGSPYVTCSIRLR